VWKGRFPGLLLIILLCNHASCRLGRIKRGRNGKGENKQHNTDHVQGRKWNLGGGCLGSGTGGGIWEMEASKSQQTALRVIIIIIWRWRLFSFSPCHLSSVLALPPIPKPVVCSFFCCCLPHLVSSLVFDGRGTFSRKARLYLGEDGNWSSKVYLDRKDGMDGWTGGWWD
jgi:hypothetical protein